MGFEIVEKFKEFHEAEAIINRDKTVAVWSNEVKNPLALRYASKSYKKGTLFNTTGLPVSSFRTGNWKK